MNAIMAKTIQQKITFNTTPDKLYKMYTNAKIHSEATGGKASFNAKAGAGMSAWNGYIKGKFLKLIKNKLIVQTWRAKGWSKSTPDSILVLSFEKNGKSTEMTMVHTNVPNKEAGHLTKGWHFAYWRPLKKYLKK